MASAGELRERRKAFARTVADVLIAQVSGDRATFERILKERVHTRADAHDLIAELANFASTFVLERAHYQDQDPVVMAREMALGIELAIAEEEIEGDA